MHIFHAFALRILLLLSSLSCTLVQAAGTSAPGRQPIHLEKILAQIRSKQPDMTVITTKLAQRDKKEVRVIDYLDLDKSWHRAVVDAFTGKVYDDIELKAPIPLETALERLKQKHSVTTVLRSALDQIDGQKVLVIEFIDPQDKRWRTTLDAYTGRVINEFRYAYKPDGKVVDLNTAIEKAKTNHNQMVVLKTRLSYRGADQVREIIYLDESRHKKRLVINAISGETIEDKPFPGIVL